ncbi:nitrate- and nitrite sensing domain-containing protein [Streptomyces phyllanthi]
MALLLVPLLSLTGIWAFATFLTARDVNQLFKVSYVVEEIGYPTEDTIQVLQEERRQTLVYLADPRASDALTALKRSQDATDEAVAAIRKKAEDSDVQDEMGEDTATRLTTILDSLDGLSSLRSAVEAGTVDVSQALEAYNDFVDPCFTMLANLHVLDNVEMDKEGRALVNVARARELLSREDALLSSAFVSGSFTRDEIRDVSDLVAQRTLMYEVTLPLLPVTERERFEYYWDNAGTGPLRVAEQSVINAEPGKPSGVTAKTWDSAVDDVLDELAELNIEAGDRFQERVRPLVVTVVLKAVIAGVLGLAALLYSLFMSVRIGRSLVRDLRRLRQDAHEAAGVRLPSVMRRLSVGEKVDVETEVPRLEYDKTEMGEVGQAVNTLQRAAVEAAVKQSELRDGISEVFVNLARRSQVLLHKQLTLLDTMERRTEDTEELADLFRLDHLTTRMRRHAEGLVILSGAAPSRQWRKPIQLMDIVRAAVAEVEDYERIEVRRLPRVAITGPAVADLTHLVAELLENATVFSPPHTAVQVLGERVANGFTLEIHDRGLGMAAEALLEANLRLAETPEFELSDTDRLGLFVVSRLAQRQNVRVSLQPSPYGGTTAVVFIPDALLTDDIPDTNGVGFRLDRVHPSREAELEAERRAALSEVPVRLPGLPPSLLDGPIELEAPVDLDAPVGLETPSGLDAPVGLGDAFGGFPDALDDEDGERGGLFRPRHSIAGAPGEQQQRRDPRAEPAHLGDADTNASDGPAQLPRRRAPKLVSSHGRPVTERPRRGDGKPSERPEPASSAGLEAPRPLPARRGDHVGLSALPPADRKESGARSVSRAAQEPPGLPRRRRATPPNETTGTSPGAATASGEGESGNRPLPRRVRQASLAPQLKDGPARRVERDSARTDGADPAERDADEVRSRMASLQRGWQRGREENVAGDGARDGSARGTTKGDGR